MATRSLITLVLSTALLGAAATGSAQLAGGTAHAVPGEKLDSGLGELPHYREWSRVPGLARLVVPTTAGPAQGQGHGPVPGEKLDSGLGELPPYRDWGRYGITLLVR